MARREARNFLVLGWKQIIFVLKKIHATAVKSQETDTTIRCLSLRLIKREQSEQTFRVVVC